MHYLKNFWVKVLLTAIAYFVIVLCLDYFWDDNIYSSKYFIKKIMGSFIWGFIFSMMITPENPFRKKKTF